MGIQIHRAIKPLVDLGVAALKAANNIWTGSYNIFDGNITARGTTVRIGNDANTDIATQNIAIGSISGHNGDSPTTTTIRGNLSLTDATPSGTLTLTEKGLWQNYLDVPSTDQALGAVHFDYPQPSITPAQQQTARTNIGVVPVGGVYFAPQSPAVNGRYPMNGPSGDFEALFRVYIDGTDQWFASEGTGGYDGYGIRFSATGRYFGIYTQTNTGLLPGHVVSGVADGWHWVGIRRTGTTLIASIDGVDTSAGFNETTARVWNSVGIDYHSGGNADHGTIAEHKWFNRALTDSERVAVMRGEIPAALAGCARPIAEYRGVFGESMGGSYGSSESISGFTVVAATGGMSTNIAPGGAAQYVSPGKTLRLNFTCTVSAGPNPQVRLILPGGGTASGTMDVVPGSNHIEIITTGNVQYIEFITGTDYTISGFSIESIGTVARYEPENVTSLGRWLDSSGNGYDLIPGSGITPLKPQPVQQRTMRWHRSEAGVLHMGGDKSWFGTVSNYATGCYLLNLPANTVFANTTFQEESLNPSVSPGASHFAHTRVAVGDGVYWYTVDKSNGNSVACPIYGALSWPE